MTAFLSSLTGLQNFSLLTVPAAWILCLAPHIYAVSLTRGHFKFAAPRSYVASMQKKTTKSAIDERFLRAEAAQSNGFENLALYAVAISLGNLARLPSDQLNKLSLAYLTSRVLFNVVYIFNSNTSLFWLRSLPFFWGLGIVFKLFYSSAVALQ